MKVTVELTYEAFPDGAGNVSVVDRLDALLIEMAQFQWWVDDRGWHITGVRIIE